MNARTVSFTVNIEPKPAPRPRATKYNHVYMPMQYRMYQRQIIAVAKLTMQGRQPLAGPLVVDIECYFTIPKSWPKYKKYEAAIGYRRPTSKNLGDVDNFMKGVLDSCNGIVFVDDSQIVDGRLKKYYSSTAPYIKVLVQELP